MIPVELEIILPIGTKTTQIIHVGQRSEPKDILETARQLKKNMLLEESPCRIRTRLEQLAITKTFIMTHKTRIKWIKILYYVVGILLLFATVFSFIAKQYITAVCDILWLSFIVIELRDLKLQDEIADANQKFFGFVYSLGKIVREHGIAYVVPSGEDNELLEAKEPENINKEEEK